MPRLASLCCLCLALLAAGCRREGGAAVAEEPVRPEQPDQESWQVTFDVSNSGRPRMRMEAGYMARFERGDSSYTVLHGGLEPGTKQVRVLLYDLSGEHTATLTAGRVTYLETRRRMEAQDAVVVTTPTGRRLESEHLVWDEAGRKVRTPGFVRITTPDERVQGFRLVADEDLASYSLARITGQVTVREE